MRTSALDARNGAAAMMAADGAASEQWQRLVDRLDAEMDAIVDDFMAELGERGRYDRDAVGEQDLRDTAADTLRMLVARLGGRAPTHEEAVLATSLGVRRARQGVPLDALLEAVRLDFRVLWRWLTRLAGDGQDAVLVAQVERVLTVVEGYVDEVQQSFLLERAAMQRDARLATERHLARLLSGDAPGAAAVEAIAQGLGVDPQARFDLVAVPVDRIEAAQRALAARLAAGSAFGGALGDAYCLFQVQGGHALDAGLEGLPGVRLPGLRGLSAVALAARSALPLLAALPEGAGMLDLEELWPHVAAHRLAALVPGFLQDRASGLDALTDYQRGAILSTVRAYLATGSVHATAGRMFCHRNTVLNRLAAFRERTGLDVQVPVQASLAQVLLAAHGGGVARGA